MIDQLPKITCSGKLSEDTISISTLSSTLGKNNHFSRLLKTHGNTPNIAIANVGVRFFNLPMSS